MSNQHPITPPPELVQEWTSLANEEEGHEVWSSIATQAAQWGADQELEACCEWITKRDWTWTSAQLRAARRPKPPSLKEQALELVRRIEGTGSPWALSELSVVRRALEALPND